MTTAIWPKGKKYILVRVDFVFVSEDGESTRRIVAGKRAEYLYGKAINEIAKAAG